MTQSYAAGLFCALNLDLVESRQVVRPNLELRQERTRAGVLSVIGLHGPVSRTIVARMLGVSPATVTSSTKELLELGLIQTIGKEPSEGGRPAELLELVADSAHIIGAKVTPDRIIGVTTDLSGNVLGDFTEGLDGSAERLLQELEGVLRGHMGDGPGTLLGVGLGLPGMVDSADGGRVFAPTLGWDGIEVGAGIQRRLGVPVIVENDVHTLAVAERLYGRGRDVDDFITVTVGHGIGLGIVVGGELHAGSAGGAGEIGHLLMDPDGPVCECGRRGCLEAVSSEPALVRRAVEAMLIGSEEGIEDLRRLAHEGDQTALSLFSDAGQLLGRAVASVVNLLSPRLILISGEGTSSWPYLEKAFTAEFRDRLLHIHHDIEVAVDHWEDLNWARGAVSLLTRSVFAPSATDGVVERLVRSRLAGTNDREVTAHGG